MKALLNGGEVEIVHRIGIRAQLEANNALEMFKQLKAKNLCFLKRSAEDGVDQSEEEEDMVHFVYNLASPPRKRPHIQPTIRYVVEMNYVFIATTVHLSSLIV